MKTRFTVIIAGVAGVMLAVAAPASPAQDAVIGAMAGGTYSDFSHPDTKSRWGFSGGLFGGVETYRTLNLFEVSYTQKGGKTQNGGDTRIDYIDLALTAGGLTKSNNGSGGRGYAGFSVAFPVSCTSTGGGAQFNGFCDNKNTEWAIPVGILLGKWNRNGGFVGIDARYSIPLSDASLGIYNNTWIFRFVFGRLR